MLKTKNFTKLTNDFLDNYLHKLSGTAVKLFLLINRKTTGFHKIRDFIALSQLTKGTGLTKKTVQKGIRELLENDLINITRSGTGKGLRTFFSIKISKEEPVKKSRVSKTQEKIITHSLLKDLEPQNIIKKEAKSPPISTQKGGISTPIKPIKGVNFTPTKEINLNKKASLKKTQKKSTIKQQLLSRQISKYQTNKILSEFESNYIQDKIDQYDYVSQNFPEKINNKARYLYMSIINDWVNNQYTKDKINKHNKEIQQQKNIELQKIQEEQKKKEVMLREYEKNIEQLAKQHYKKLDKAKRTKIEQEITKKLNQKPFLRDCKAAFKIAFESNLMDSIKQNLTAIPSFEDFCKKETVFC